MICRKTTVAWSFLTFYISSVRPSIFRWIWCWATVHWPACVCYGSWAFSLYVFRMVVHGLHHEEFPDKKRNTVVPGLLFHIVKARHTALICPVISNPTAVIYDAPLGVILVNYILHFSLNPFNPEFTIVIFTHYKPQIAAAILDL